jgi:hypothetical protein
MTSPTQSVVTSNISAGNRFHATTRRSHPRTQILWARPTLHTHYSPGRTTERRLVPFRLIPARVRGRALLVQTVHAMDTGPRKQGPRVPVDSTTDVPFRRSGALPDPLRRLLFLIVPSLAILTPSYAPDFALCRELNESVLQWSPSSVVHHIVVPGRDRAVFEPLRSPRTEIWSVDHFLPRRMVGVPKANMWLNVRRPFPPVRGWIMQQVMKLCAAAELGADVTILVDSDVLFVRPIKLETFQQGTKLRFFKKPEAIDVTLPRHLVWHNVARDMLGLPPAGRPPLPDYVGPLHAWDRKVVTAGPD